MCSTLHCRFPGQPGLQRPLFVSLEASSVKTSGSEYYWWGQALGDLASGPHDTPPFLSEMVREPHGPCLESLFQRLRNDNVGGALLPRDPGPLGKKNRELDERERERKFRDESQYRPEQAGRWWNLLGNSDGVV